MTESDPSTSIRFWIKFNPFYFERFDYYKAKEPNKKCINYIIYKFHK